MSESVNSTPVNQNDAVQHLPNAINDGHGGVIVEVSEPMDSAFFASMLRASIAQWRHQGKKGVWIKFPIQHLNLIEAAVKEGFRYHHAEPNYLMRAYWIPEGAQTLPANASHRVGVGAFVMNEKIEVKIVAESSSNPTSIPVVSKLDLAQRESQLVQEHKKKIADYKVELTVWRNRANQEQRTKTVFEEKSSQAIVEINRRHGQLERERAQSEVQYANLQAQYANLQAAYVEAIDVVRGFSERSEETEARLAEAGQRIRELELALQRTREVLERLQGEKAGWDMEQQQCQAAYHNLDLMDIL